MARKSRFSRAAFAKAVLKFYLIVGMNAPKILAIIGRAGARLTSEDSKVLFGTINIFLPSPCQAQLPGVLKLGPRPYIRAATERSSDFLGSPALEWWRVRGEISASSTYVSNVSSWNCRFSAEYKTIRRNVVAALVRAEETRNVAIGERLFPPWSKFLFLANVWVRQAGLPVRFNAVRGTGKVLGLKFAAESLPVQRNQPPARERAAMQIEFVRVRYGGVLGQASPPPLDLRRSYAGRGVRRHGRSFSPGKRPALSPLDADPNLSLSSARSAKCRPEVRRHLRPTSILRTLAAEVPRFWKCRSPTSIPVPQSAPTRANFGGSAFSRLNETTVQKSAGALVNARWRAARDLRPGLPSTA